VIFFWAERATIWMVSKIVFVSSAEQNRALGDGLVKQEKSAVIANGVEIPKITPDLPQENTIILVGRLAEPKQPEDLLNAAPIILKAIPNAKFILVGDGPK